MSLIEASLIKIEVYMQEIKKALPDDIKVQVFVNALEDELQNIKRIGEFPKKKASRAPCGWFIPKPTAVPPPQTTPTPQTKE